MANNYCQHAAERILIGSKEVYDILLKALEESVKPEEDEYGDKDYHHGFSLKFYPEVKPEGFIYLYAEEGGDSDELPPAFLEALGGLIETNKLPYLEIGYAITCDKMRVGEFGGGSYRINTKGELVYPNITWPE